LNEYNENAGVRVAPISMHDFLVRDVLYTNQLVSAAIPSLEEEPVGKSFPYDKTFATESRPTIGEVK